MSEEESIVIIQQIEKYDNTLCYGKSVPLVLYLQNYILGLRLFFLSCHVYHLIGSELQNSAFLIELHSQSDASVIPRRRNKWGAVASGGPSHRTGVGPLLAGGPLTDS